MAIKLHVGCGDDLKEGYVNIDAFNPRADLVMPIQQLDYPADTVECVECYMLLEHLSLADTRDFIAKVHRMLQPGGEFICEFPDLEKVSRLVLLFAGDPDYLEKGAFGLRGFFGEPTDHMTTGDHHKWGYTPSIISKLLREAGFARFSITDGFSHCYPLRDMRIEAIKSER